MSTAITPISSVSDGGRFNIRGNACNVRSKPYPSGEMLLFDVEDSSGSIPAIVWADAFDVFKGVIVNGRTYKFMNTHIKSNPRNNGRVEIKLYKNSIIENCTAMQVRHSYGTVSAGKSSATGAHTIYVSAIVCDIGEDGETTKAGEPMRRIKLIDQTGELQCFVLGECASTTLTAGEQHNVSGNISSNGSMFVTSMAPVETCDASLADFWKTQAPSKKARAGPALSAVADIATANPGDAVELTCVIRTASLTPTEMSPSRLKYTFRVVDKSMASVELAIFQAKEIAAPEFTIGDVIHVKATVSPYNTRSLTAKLMPTPAKDDDLAFWWSQLNDDDDAFLEISVDSRAQTVSGGLNGA